MYIFFYKVNFGPGHNYNYSKNEKVFRDFLQP